MKRFLTALLNDLQRRQRFLETRLAVARDLASGDIEHPEQFQFGEIIDRGVGDLCGIQGEFFQYRQASQTFDADVVARAIEGSQHAQLGKMADLFECLLLAARS